MAVVALALFALAPPAARAAGLTVSPAPHTPDASPQTQISVLGPPIADIRAVRVRGETSGLHGGHLEAYSGHRGASFLLDEPLTQGEKVDVLVKVKGRGPKRFSFTVAHLDTTPPTLNLTQTQPEKLHHWVSRPDLIPPRIAVDQTSPQVAGDGKLLLTPTPSPVVHPGSGITIHSVGPGGPMLADAQGRVIWFKQLQPPEVAANLRVQRYHGHRVLTWWQGTVNFSAFGAGEGIIANHSYRVVKSVQAGNGYSMDIHEFSLTHSGDALFTVYSPILVHLPGTPPDTLSKLLDAAVQEVDIRTGLVVWEWHAYGHIPLSDSYATPQNSASYDAFHINSIQPLAGDRALISARDTSAIYEIDKATGKLIWKLGGKDSSFDLGPGARFHFQHNAQMLGGGQIGMFDDEAGPPEYAPSSRGLILKLSRDGRTARVARSYQRPDDTSAQSEGSLQVLPSGRVFVDFGAQRFFSEFSPSGQLLYDGSLPVDDGTYRMYREHWNAHPHTVPTAATVANGESVSVYASWNGATRVARWQVLAGDGPDALEPVATGRRFRFETRIDVPAGPAYFAVRALGQRGRVLGISHAVPAP
jgi:arylsulfotransferase ASST